MSGLGHLVKFSIVSFSLTLILLSFYFRSIVAPEGILAWLYVISIPAYYYMIILIVSFLLIPLYFMRYTRYLAITPKVVLDSYLFCNLFVLDIFKSNIDTIFIYIAIHDFNGIGIPPYILILAFASFAIILSLNMYAFIKARYLKKWPAKIALAIVILFIIGQSLHIWGVQYNQRYITRYTQDFPCFFPVKWSSFIKKIEREYPAIVPVHTQVKELNIDSYVGDGAVFHYPLRQLKFLNSPGEKYNIIFFVLESWRSDMMNERVTPIINDFAKKSYVFTNHLSGGNVTHTGLFSLMYGLHPTYMKFVEADPTRYPPALISVLKDNGYAISAYTSSNLEGFSLKVMFFNGVPEGNYVAQLKEASAKGDAFVISKLVGSIKNKRTASPFFAFVFLTSSHHGYKYPDSHNIFHPTAQEGSYLFNKYSDPAPLLNKYKNSLHYEDSLFGEVLSALREVHLDMKTIIVVTSDHGEEFNDKDHGYWGHGSNFSRYQTSVPLIIYLPESNAGCVVSKRSSHVDIASTLLKRVFGCSNDFSDYSSGSDLLHLPDNRGLIVKSYNTKAYVIDDVVYSEGITLDSYEINDIGNKNRNIDYRKIELLKVSESKFMQ